jgi:hypothetical protein
VDPADPQSSPEPDAEAEAEAAMGGKRGVEAPRAAEPAWSWSPAYAVKLRLQNSGLRGSTVLVRPAVQQAVDTIREAVVKTVRSHQNNSLFVTGPPSSGKTLVRTPPAQARAARPDPAWPASSLGAVRPHQQATLVVLGRNA